MAPDLLENRLAVGPGLGIAFPAIDSVTSRVQPMVGRALAQAEIRVAEMCPEFDNQTGGAFEHQPVGKRQVTNPTRRAFLDVAGAEIPRSNQAG